MGYRPSAPRLVPQRMIWLRAIAGARSTAHSRRNFDGPPARFVDLAIERITRFALFLLIDIALANDSMQRNRHSPPSGRGKMRSCAARRLPGHKTFGIPTAVLRWRERRNSQTLSPGCNALVF